MLQRIQRFIHPTFVVLDVPQPQAGDIWTIRATNGFHATEPVTITVAGSSGVGVFSSEQSPPEAFAILDEVAADHVPIRAAFGSVLRFPGTDIFVFTLQPEEPFRQLHQAVVGSGLRFRGNRFPYKPHCTFRTVAPDGDAQLAALLGLSICGTFELRSLSVFGWHLLDNGELECPLYHRTQLRENSRG
jgi:hypothetical protein